MTKSMTDSEEKTLTDQEVTNYLLANRDFFIEHSELLTEINFPHETSGAISLIERQVQVLRENEEASKDLIAELTANANANHELLKKMQSLTLQLIRSDSLHDLLSTLSEHIHKAFGLDQIQLLMSKESETPNLPHAQYLPQKDIDKVDSDILNLKAYVGRVPAKLSDYFSTESLEVCESIALIRLDIQGASAYLLIGSAEEKRFQSDMGTDFIEYIGEMLSLLFNALKPADISETTKKSSKDSE